MQTELYHVYILANRHRTIYTGVTRNLVRRLAEHRAGIGSAFTRRYKIDRLVYVESTPDVSALCREKQTKWLGSPGKKSRSSRKEIPTGGT